MACAEPDGYADNDEDFDDDFECVPNFADCTGLCGGLAELDDCGVCSGGTSGHEANSDDIGCGCFAPAPVDFCIDGDGDGLGVGTGTQYCAEMGAITENTTAEIAPEGWVDDCSDPDDDCYGSVTDCNGDCGGSAFPDDCGVCSGGDTNHQANSDIDCFGDCAPETPVGCVDETGNFECGNATIDDCNICSGGNTGHLANSDLDCNEDCFGSAFIDDCGECVGGGTGMNENWALDCNNDCFGTADFDQCGVCSGGLTGHIANSDDLGCGCFVNGPATYCFDADGDGLGGEVEALFCASLGTPTDNTEYGEVPADWVEDCSDPDDDCEAGWYDCAGICGGPAFEDVCGHCVEGSTGLAEFYSDLGCGCNVAGPVSFCYDGDNDNMGFPPSELYCADLGTATPNTQYDAVPNNWILDCSDPDPDCAYGTSDCAGVCNGTAAWDNCGVCAGGGTGIVPNEADQGCGCFVDGPDYFCLDQDNDNMGAGIPDLYCSEMGDTTPNTDYTLVPSNWVTDCSDPEPDCTTNNTDCAGICGGGAADDNCNICSGGTSGHIPNSDDVGCGCFADPPIDYCFDSDGDDQGAGESELFCADIGQVTPNTQFGLVPADWVEDCTDLEPDCATNDTDCNDECGGSAFEDDCGYCVAGNTGLDENFADLGCGCDVPAAQEYYEDTDGDGLGFGDAALYCAEMGTATDNTEYDLVPNGWVTDCCDPDPDCAGALTDCFGDCGGAAYIDLCGDCVEGNTGLSANYTDLGCGCDVPTAIEFCQDIDNDGLGAGTAVVFCAELGVQTPNTIYSEFPTGWVADCTDPDDQCLGGLTDCFGECGGAAFTDTCGDCVGGSTGMVENEADLGCGCDAPAPIDYFEDLDADGLGFGDGQLYCSELGPNTPNTIYDLFPDGWVTECCDPDPDCANALTDCNGECGGTAFIDLCGSCVAGNTGVTENYLDLGCGCDVPAAVEYCQDNDADGLGAGTALLFCAELGIQTPNTVYSEAPDGWVADCTDPDDQCLNGTTDCYGECNGTAFIDACGDCVGGSSGLVENGADLGCGCDAPAPAEYFEDSDGDGSGYGDASMYCSEMGPSTPNTIYILVPGGWVILCCDPDPNCADAITDCNNECGGAAFVDNCGDCVGGSTGYNANFADIGCGCDVAGPLTYCIDSDGDNLGAGTEAQYCAAVGTITPNTVSILAPSDWVPDCTDPDDTCANGVADCYGECGGSAIIDNCGICSGGNTGIDPNSADVGCGCFLPAPQSYCNDLDGDGLGNPGSALVYCLADLPTGWVLDCTDPEPNCATNDTDCYGDCGGTAYEDVCGDCVAGNTGYDPCIIQGNIWSGNEEDIIIGDISRNIYFTYYAFNMIFSDGDFVPIDIAGFTVFPDLLSLPDPGEDYILYGLVYEIEPNNFVFQDVIDVTLPLPQGLARNQPNWVILQLDDRQDQNWNMLSNIRVDGTAITGSTNSFGLFIVADWLQVIGCNGDPTSYINECGDCVTVATDNCLQDCEGVWGGTATIDACGVCDADPTNDNQCVLQISDFHFYPNPILGSGMITYQLPKNCQSGKLRYYNFAGEEVATQKLTASALTIGLHEIPWNNPDDLPRGAYVVVMTVSDGQTSGKGVFKLGIR